MENLARHEYRGASLTIPEGWLDLTSVVLAAPPFDDSAARFVMVHEPLEPQGSLHTHAARRLARLSRTLSEFDLLPSEDICDRVAGQPAVCARFRWTTTLGRAEQLAVLIDARPFDRNAVIVFTSSALASVARAVQGLFASFLASVRLTPSKRDTATHALPDLPR